MLSTFFQYYFNIFSALTIDFIHVKTFLLLCRKLLWSYTLWTFILRKFLFSESAIVPDFISIILPVILSPKSVSTSIFSFNYLSTTILPPNYFSTSILPPNYLSTNITFCEITRPHLLYTSLNLRRVPNLQLTRCGGTLTLFSEKERVIKYK